MVAVPSPLLWKVRPFGSFRPIMESVGVGTPVVVMVNENGVPATTLAMARLVNDGEGLFTALNCTAGTYHGGAAVVAGYSGLLLVLLTLQHPDVVPLPVG